MKTVVLPLVMATFLAQAEPATTHYSTCPSSDQAAKLSDLYVKVDTPELLKYAKVRVQAKLPPFCRCEGQVQVRVMVKGERVFCATAVYGHPLLQKEAVQAAMQWRFKKKRPPFKSNIQGIITFDFKLK